MSFTDAGVHHASMRAFPLMRVRILRMICSVVLLAIWAPAAATQVPARAAAPYRPLSHWHHTSWGEEDGLSPNALGRLMRSSDGYLWLGGDGPLMRFDGVRFTRFDGTTQPELKSAEVGSLRLEMVDREGTLWISRPDGALVRYRNGRFQLVLPPNTDARRVTAMAQDGLGRLWLTGLTKLGLHRLEGDSLVHVALPVHFQHLRLLGVIADIRDGIWVGTYTEGLLHVTPRGVSMHLNPTLGDPGARPLVQTADGTVWTFGDGLQLLKDGQWSTLASPEDGAKLIPPTASVGPDGAVWVGTRGYGVVRFQNGAAELFTERHGLSDAVVASVLADHEGNVWAVTNAGLDRLRLAPFSVLTQGSDGVHFDSPHWMAADAKDGIWALSYQGQLVSHFTGGYVSGKPGMVTTHTLRNPGNSRLHPDASSMRGGVLLRDDRGNAYHATSTTMNNLGAAFADTTNRRWREDSTGQRWVTYFPQGLAREVNGRLERVVFPPDLGSPNVGDIVSTREGRTAMAVNSAPALLILEQGKIVRRYGPGDGLAHPVARVVFQNRDTLWAVDHLGSLLRIVDRQIRQIPADRLGGLLRSGSIVVMPDGPRMILASTAGIVCINMADLHAALDGKGPVPTPWRFSALDGIRTARLTTHNTAAGARAADGRIWFSTPSGLAVFDPRNIVRNTVAPRVHLESVMIGDSALSHEPTAEIPPGTPRVTLQFTATALRVPERVRIEYMLDGVDGGWRLADATRSATYTQLRPGHYTFRVRAWNEDGVAGVNEVSLPVRMLPAWHETWWFMVLLVATLAGGTAWVVVWWQRARSRDAARRLAERFEATLTERTRLAGELHDTLLQGFTGITLQLQALRRRISETPAEAEVELSRVLSVADRTLREARSMVWDMRTPELDGRDVADALEEAARQAIASAHAQSPSPSPVVLEVQVGGDRRRVAPVIETTALRIGREAVTNAARHARPSRITLALVFESHRLFVRVHDNGDGFDTVAASQAREAGHWGLVGMDERAQRVGGTVSVTSTLGEGTTVDMMLPIEPRATSSAEWPHPE
ncbi:MAG: hypothetical protein IBJ03_02590 [Gemmatimonadaceae bacterium]|nr:hypothetical protein [Gemmatimonadaceae bacterium]